MLRRFFSCDNIPTAHQNIAYRLKFCARFWVPQEQKLFDFMFLLHYSSKENLNLPFTSPFFIEIEQATWKISRHACRVSAPYQFSRLLTKTAYQHGSTGLGDDEYSSSNQRWDIISLHTGALAARTQRSHSTIVYTIWGDRPGVTRVLVGWPLSSTSHSPVRSQFRVRVWRRHSERCPLCGGELKEKKTPLPFRHYCSTIKESQRDWHSLFSVVTVEGKQRNLNPFEPNAEHVSAEIHRRKEGRREHNESFFHWQHLSSEQPWSSKRGCWWPPNQGCCYQRYRYNDLYILNIYILFIGFDGSSKPRPIGT